jgi:CDP-6-deoxy-D-xylo-4-hexulose-3-dehydrase
MGEKVEELEARFSEFSGAHALMLSSGSTANQLVFEMWKVKNPGEKALVIVPAVTWVSSITPALMAGMDIRFCDVNLDDFSFDYVMLDKILKETARRRQIIWPTALIGFMPDMDRLKTFAKTYGADLFLDACENTFSDGILSSCDMVTTSCYFSHQVVSIEGGFCFFKDPYDFRYAKMFRNHGLSRSLAVDDPIRRVTEIDNPDIDPSFLFAMGGTNLRPTDMHAMFGLQDFKRIEKSRNHREEIYTEFVCQMDDDKYFVPCHPQHSAFCLPIFRRDGKMSEVKTVLKKMGVESRPIIGSNLLYQPPFKQYGKPEDFPNAEWIHQHGCYVGLHREVSSEMIGQLSAILNEI